MLPSDPPESLCESDSGIFIEASYACPPHPARNIAHTSRRSGVFLLPRPRKFGRHPRLVCPQAAAKRKHREEDREVDSGETHSAKESAKEVEQLLPAGARIQIGENAGDERGVTTASLFAAFLATISARRAVYNDYQKHLIEWNRECIKEPFLAAVNDDTRLEIETRQGDEFSKWSVSGGSLKLTHFAYMQLNTFEIVYEYEMSWPNMPMMAFLRFIPWLASEANSPWMAFFVHKVRRSSELRKLIRRQDLKEYYSPRFAKFSKDVLAAYDASQLATAGDDTQSPAGRAMG